MLQLYFSNNATAITNNATAITNNATAITNTLIDAKAYTDTWRNCNYYSIYTSDCIHQTYGSTRANAYTDAEIATATTNTTAYTTADSNNFDQQHKVIQIQQKQMQ